MSDPDYLTGFCSQLACLWEVTARKPGNVHRFKDFSDMTYLDFAASAAAIALDLSLAHQAPLGETIYHCVQHTRLAVGRNTNLGIILLFVPLAMAGASSNDPAAVDRVLAELTQEDAEWVYQAIRIANPGGLGRVEEQDIRAAPTMPLRQAMALAADRDLVARQYANGFREVLEEGVPAVLEGVERTVCVEGGIIYSYLYLMSRYPDTLIVRKRGPAEARESADRAWRVLDLGWPHSDRGRREIVALDDWLRAEGHSRNPGTTADLIAASLFVLLRGRGLPQGAPWKLEQGAP